MKKAVRIKDIATLANVSLRTVSLVLNNSGRISPATRERVKAIASELNYSPNMMAKGLVNNRTYLFGVNFPYLDLSFVHSIIAGMERKCIDLNYELLLSSTNFNTISFLDSDIPLIESSLHRLSQRGVDGIVCLPDIRAYNSYDSALKNGMPLLQILRVVPDLPAPYIYVNNERGMYLATKYLLDGGHQSIGFLNYLDPQFEEVAARFRGYLRAMAESNNSIDTKKYSIACDLTQKSGYEATKTLLTRCPKTTAIIAATDYAAIGAMRACMDMGKKIPEDISIIGYDDMDFAELQGFRTLSTVRQPKEQLGALAAEYLYRMVQGEKVESTILEPELIIRESSTELKG